MEYHSLLFLRVNTCGRITMPEFSDIQKNAKDLPLSLAHTYTKQQGCLCFFSAIIPQLTNNCAWQDANALECMAGSLDVENDPELMIYFKRIYKTSENATNELVKFKYRILTGAYLFIWSRYNNSVASYLNKPLIEHFQSALEIQSPADINSKSVEKDLTAFSQYCSFVYHNRSKIKIYEELNKKLGETIQVDIHNLIQSKFAEDNSWQGLYKGLIGSFGIDLS